MFIATPVACIASDQPANASEPDTGSFTQQPSSSSSAADGPDDSTHDPHNSTLRHLQDRYTPRCPSPLTSAPQQAPAASAGTSLRRKAPSNFTQDVSDEFSDSRSLASHSNGRRRTEPDQLSAECAIVEPPTSARLSAPAAQEEHHDASSLISTSVSSS